MKIKFRTWFPGPNVMGKVTNLKGSNVGYEFDGVVAEWFIDGRQVFYEGYENFVLMQFTGLHDKNGKEIYEGDIIKVDNSPCNCKVSWSDKYASFVLTREDWIFRHYCCHGGILLFGEAYPEDCEVIGNIYESPELLQ